jgi:mannosyltransferase
MIRQLRRRFSTSQIAIFAGLLAILLASLVLRLNRLDAQSFWYDEGNSARIAERSFQLIIEGAAGDIHPPLYYLILHDWRAIFGESEAALRLFSVACGALLVLFTYLLGRALRNARTGLIAALFAAISPFAVYYSQESRMYILLALEAAISTWALIRILDFGLTIDDSSPSSSSVVRRPSSVINRQSSIVIYILSTAAGLYTQYAYPFVMIAQGVCVLLWLAISRARRRGKSLTILTYALINVVALALFLPWLPIAIRQVTSWTVAPQIYETGTALLDAFRWLVVGRTLPLDQSALPLILIATLSLLGLIFDIRSSLSTRTAPTDAQPRRGFVFPMAGRPPAAITLLILAVLPFALLFVFKLYRESYLKFLLVSATPLLLLAALGIDRLADLLPGPAHSRAKAMTTVVLSCLVILALQPSLYNLYNNPAYARDDYRGIARAIDANARPGDAILFDAPNQWEVFTYYHRDGIPAIALPYRPENPVAVDEALRPIASQYQRLFVLYYGEHESDPGAWFEQWLATRAFKAEEQWVGNIRLAVYATVAPTGTADPAVVFGDVTRLSAVSVDLSPRSRGDMIALRLTWRPGARPDRRYKVFAHLGLPDAPPLAQNDAEPAAGFRPTDMWNAGEDVVDQRAVWIKPDAPPGTYGLYVGMYDGASGQRLQAIHNPGGQLLGDRLWLGNVVVK